MCTCHRCAVVHLQRVGSSSQADRRMRNSANDETLEVPKLQRKPHDREFGRLERPPFGRLEVWKFGCLSLRACEYVRVPYEFLIRFRVIPA